MEPGKVKSAEEILTGIGTLSGFTMRQLEQLFYQWCREEQKTPKDLWEKEKLTMDIKNAQLLIAKQVNDEIQYKINKIKLERELRELEFITLPVKKKWWQSYAPPVR
jgi:maltodextrin utilization protein YvdJ